MQIAILGAGQVGSILGRLWHAVGHDVTFAAGHAARPQALRAFQFDRSFMPGSDDGAWVSSPSARCT